jgi:uncharacterized membrane protein YbhN (UPF0104 family)
VQDEPDGCASLSAGQESAIIAGSAMLADFDISVSIYSLYRMSRKKFITLIPGILLLLALVYFGMNYGELSRFIRLIVNIDPFWIALATLFQLATYFFLSMVWYRGLAVNGTVYPIGRLFPLAVAKLFADQALPSGGISGIAFVINVFKKRDVSGPVGMGVMLLSLLSYYVAFAIVAAASFFVLWLDNDFHRWMFVVSGLFFVMVIVVPGAILFLTRNTERSALPPWLKRLPLISGVVETFRDVPDDMLRKPGLLFELTVYQIAIFLLDTFTLWAMLFSLGEPGGFLMSFSAFVVASIVATLSLIPLGLGSFELTCTGLLVSLGVDVETALTATLLLRGFTLWLPMIPGLLLTRRVLR